VEKCLGIFVSSNQHLGKLIELCQAANKKNIRVMIFLSHLGTLLTQDPGFEKLQGLAEMSLCNVCFDEHGLTRPVPGIEEKDYASQARNGEMIIECNRYLVF
jgi:hypothetical protein